MKRSPEPIVALVLSLQVLFSSSTALAQQVSPSISTPHSDMVYSVTFSPNGRQVLSGSKDKTIKLWDVRTGRLLRTLKGHADAVQSVAFLPNGQQAVSGSRDATVKLWDLLNGELVRTYKGHNCCVNSVAVSANGEMIASGGGGESGDKLPEYADKVLRIWSVSNGNMLHALKGHTSSITHVAFARQGDLLASGGGDWDHTVKLWRASTGELVRTLKGHEQRIESLAFSPNGKHIAAGSFFSGDFRVWSAGTGTQVALIQEGFSPSSVAAYSSDGKYLALGQLDGMFGLFAVGSHEMVQIYGASRLVNGESSGTKQDPGSWAMSADFSPDNSMIVTGHMDAKVKMWGVPSGKLLGTLPRFLGGVPQGTEDELTGLHTSETELPRGSAPGLFVDQETGLEWLNGPDRDMNWYNATEWVNGLTVAGEGWRMPTRRELKDLHERHDPHKFLDVDGAAAFIWSGDTTAPVSGYEQAYRVNFYNGDVDHFACVQRRMYRAIAVRSAVR